MIEIELEKTYLVKSMPEDLSNYPHREILDIYIPKEITHPTLRLRMKGDSHEITKKHPAKENDSSEQEEHTIRLSKAEFDVLAGIHGKRVRKIRYNYLFQGNKAEIDVFQDDLKGLVLVDFEFKNLAEKDSFTMPPFCLIDVTQDSTFAGGMLCGKKYSDIKSRLDELGYVYVQR